MVRNFIEREDIRSTFDPKYLRLFLGVVFLIYVITSLYYGIIGYKEETSSYHEFARIILVPYYFMMIMLCYVKGRYKTLFAINAVLFFIIVVLIKASFKSAGVGEFSLPAESGDGYTYFDRPLRYYGHPVGDLISYLTDTAAFRFDDLGYFMIVFYIQQIYPNDQVAIYSMLLLNSVLIYYSGVYLYKLQMMFTGDALASKIAGMLYCASPFIVINASVFMKETIFVFIIIMFFYHLYSYRQTLSAVSLVGMVVFMLASLLFRTAIFYMEVLCLIIAFTANKMNSRMYLYVLFGALFFTSLLASLVLKYVFGTSLDNITAIADYRMNNFVNSEMRSVTSWIAGLFGPFPNYDRPAAGAFMHAVFSLVKFSLTIFFARALYSMIKGYKYWLYPIMVYLFVSVYMTIVAAVSLDMRYHMTYVPLFFLITVPYVKRFKTPFVIPIYMAIVVVMCYIYSTRPVTY